MWTLGQQCDGSRWRTYQGCGWWMRAASVMWVMSLMSQGRDGLGEGQLWLVAVKGWGLVVWRQVAAEWC
jgi:hypothetical protein